VCCVGDVIGALWNRIDRTISFFKNGVSLGVAFSDVLEDRLYPTVGLRTTNEEVSRVATRRAFRLSRGPCFMSGI
jgi:SPRY domain